MQAGRRRLWRRRAPRIVVSVAAALAMTACGVPGGSSTSTKGAQGSKAKTIVFWHYLTDREALLKQFAAQYKKKTGVTVKLSLLPTDTLQQKFQAAVQAKTLPDLVASWTGAGDGLAPYAKQGVIANLDTAMSTTFKDRFPTEATKAVSFLPGNSFGVQPGPYLVPLDTNNMQILYNKDLFSRAGISTPPQTWDELASDAKKLRSAGIEPFVSGFNAWPLDSFATVYMWNIVGESTMQSTFAGRTKYSSPAWIKFLTRMASLRSSGLLAKGILGEDLPAAETQFVNGKAAMIFDGSWAIGVFNQSNPGFKNYGVFMPPPAPGATNPMYIPGGVGAQLFVVKKNAAQQRAVLDFVDWLTRPAQQVQYAEKSFNLPANQNVDEAKLSSSPALAAFSSKMGDTFPQEPMVIPTAVTSTMDAGLQLLLNGKSSPAKVAAAMDRAAKSKRAEKP